jgi:DNA end-binding protein Ku
MSPRASANVLLSFGAFPVFIKLYAVASERAASLSQVHSDCGEKLVQQYVCAKDGSVVPKAAMAKQYRFDDGTVTTLTDEDVKSAGPEAEGQIELLECVPENSLDPVWLGKTTFVGPDQDRGIDGYIALVDALTAARATAVCRYSTRSRDQLVVIQRYGERGLLMREVFYADELRPLEEIELPRSVPNPLMAEAFAGVIARSQKERLAHAAYKDGYPERLLRAATDRANAGSGASGATTVSLLKAGQKRAAKGASPATAKAGVGSGTVRKIPTMAARVAPANGEADGLASGGDE